MAHLLLFVGRAVGSQLPSEKLEPRLCRRPARARRNLSVLMKSAEEPEEELEFAADMESLPPARGFGDARTALPGKERRLVLQTPALTAKQKLARREQKRGEPKWTTDDLAPQERLQKVLARLGVASRRGCEELISRGRVRVNGKVVTELGTKVDASRDKLVVDGESVTESSSRKSSAIRWVAVHKPRGYVSTVTDNRGRRSIVDLVPNARAQGLVPVGRMDVGSTGLMMLTNELSMCHLLTHPSYSHEKRYIVHVRGPRMRAMQMDKLRAGVVLPAEQGSTGGRTGPGGAMKRYLSPARREKTAPCEVEFFSYENSITVLGIVLREGMKRQIRRMISAVGAGEVAKLHRVSYGCVELGSLRYGQWREMDRDEVRRLRSSAKRAVIGDSDVRR